MENTCPFHILFQVLKEGLIKICMILFSMGFVEERISASINVSENMMERFSKKLKYVIVFQLNNRKKPLN